jgi:hypothetical protein
MVDNQQWSAPGLNQILEMAAGILPREFESAGEIPGHNGRAFRSSGVSTDLQSGDGKRSTGLRLNPSFVEWMMGCPTCSECGRGWTDPDCPHSAMAFKYS